MDKFKLERTKGNSVTDDELLADLRFAAEQKGKRTIGMNEYQTIGKFDNSTISRRFGTWNYALVKAGLETSNEVYISEDQLFENILALWSVYGRQPRRSELALPPSKYSQSPYNRAFGSWSESLRRFVDYANATDKSQTEQAELPKGRKTGRDPSLRLRYKVLVRDNFACVICGSSPALKAGVELHIDHVIPWSKGGDTIESNLRTLCSKCNLGKGDLMGAK